MRDVKKIVKNSYSKIAKKESCSCCGGTQNEVDIAKSIGYSDEEMNSKVVDPRSGKERYIGDLMFDHIIHQSDMIGHITTKRGMRSRALNIKHHGTFRVISDEDRTKIRSFKK